MLKLARIVLMTAVLCSTVSARAQTADPDKIAAAQTLYNEAVTLMDAKDYATACPKLAEAVRLVPEGIGRFRVVVSAVRDLDDECVSPIERPPVLHAHRP